MSTRIALLALLIALAAGCKSVDCGEGTTERDGACVPANEIVGAAQCGPFTELQGTLCVPVFPPTVCDPGTTAEDVDGMGVTTCIGTGAGGCSARLACPAPTDGKHTICGQIYDIENDQPFAQAGAAGTECTPGATAGPCALGIRAFDAVALASTMDPTSVPALQIGPVYIDDCGRYRVSEIPVPMAGFIALAIDDAMAGPAGITNTVGLATSAMANMSTRDFDAFIVRPATTTAWASSGGPTLASGYFVPVFRGQRTGADLAAGVTVTFGPITMPQQPPTSTDIGRDFYFAADAAPRTTLSAGASITGVNGTALFSAVSLLGEVYSGQGGGLPAQCRWSIHAGTAKQGIVFIQTFRPINNGPNATCPL